MYLTDIQAREIKGNIEIVRQRKGLSQKKFAELLGMNYTAYSKFKNGGSNPTVALIITVCEKFDQSADWILMGKGTGENGSLSMVKEGEVLYEGKNARQWYEQAMFLQSQYERLLDKVVSKL